VLQPMRRALPTIIAAGVLALGLIVGGVATGVVLAAGYHDAAARWTAIGAILAGGALAVAAIGVPVAIAQLVSVERDLARLTTASEGERELQACPRRGTELALMIEGSRIMQQLGPSATFQMISRARGDAGEAIDQLLIWTEATGSSIGRVTDETEERFFHLAGRGKPWIEEINAKLAFIRSDVMPNVRAGLWTT
jgi:hypothetical protein